MNKIQATIERIAMIPVHDSITYRVYTDKGVVNVQQIVDGDSPSDKLFYEPIWGIYSKNIREVVERVLWWDDDYSKYLDELCKSEKECQDEF